jgi:hypothetical protein
MGLKILGCDIFSGTTQGWVYPIIVASKVKGACIKVAQTLILRLQCKCLDQEVMNAMGMVYPEY